MGNATTMLHARGMHPRLNVVTLGVADLPRALRFYTEGLGFVASSSGNEHVAFFRAGGVVLALFGREALAHDANLPIGNAPVVGTFGGITLAHNRSSSTEVDAFFAKALAAGARALKDPGETFWGGYSGYFADLDGHPWEVAYNPFWPLTIEGIVELPD